MGDANQCRASCHWIQVGAQFCLVYIYIYIYMPLLSIFRATMCPSSGEITVSMWHWYLSICMGGVWSAGWSFIPTSRPDATHTEWQIPVSHGYSNFSWWWAHSCPKHVEKRHIYTKQNCARSWIYLQDCTRMHCQQNLKFSAELSLCSFSICFLLLFNVCYQQVFSLK